jgi:4-amino-4-deoxy-L-arabinose transferase-like glycosyltransferase
MLEYGNWIKTTMNLEPRYEKPPLPTWLTAFSASIFGLKSLFGLRLPAVLSVTFLVFMSYFLGKKVFKNLKQALFAALILATSFYIVFSGRNGQWDIFAHAFMLFAIYQLFLAFESKHALWKNWILAGIFIGLSFMSKGPVSHFALLLPFLISYGMVYKFQNFKKKISPLVISILLFAIVGLSWGIYIYLNDGSSAEAIADKETAAWSDRNVRPFYYYWSFFTQSGLWTFFAFIGLLYPFMKKRVENLQAYRFTFFWTIITVILLSLIPEKKSRYLLPVLIPLALNTSFYIIYLAKKTTALKKVDTYIANFGFGLIGVICLAFPLIGYFYFGEKLENHYLPFILSSVALVVIGVFIFRSLQKKYFEKAFYLNIAMMCVIMTLAFPLAKIFYDNSDFKNISELRQTESFKNLPIYSAEDISPELIWELGEPVTKVKDLESVTENQPFGFLSKDSILTNNSAYRLKFVEQYDINYINKNKKGYKTRLTTKLYLVEKK